MHLLQCLELWMSSNLNLSSGDIRRSLSQMTPKMKDTGRRGSKIMLLPEGIWNFTSFIGFLNYIDNIMNLDLGRQEDWRKTRLLWELPTWRKRTTGSRMTCRIPRYSIPSWRLEYIFSNKNWWKMMICRYFVFCRSNWDEERLKHLFIYHL